MFENEVQVVKSVLEFCPPLWSLAGVVMPDTSSLRTVRMNSYG